MNQVTSGYIQVPSNYLGQTGAAPSYQYQSSVASYPATSPSTKVPQIPHQQTELAERLYLQEKLLSVLSEKLQPVMSLHPPQEAMGQEEKADLGPTCPVANSLYRLAILAGSSNRIIQSLIDRVEV